MAPRCHPVKQRPPAPPHEKAASKRHAFTSGIVVPYRPLSILIVTYRPSRLYIACEAGHTARMPALDLEALYGQMVPIGDLARLFHANQRAMRAALERRAVPIFEFGNSTVVPLRLVEQVFGLAALLADDDEVRHQAALFRSRYGDDGERKPLHEYVAEVDARAEGWLADLERARAAAR